MEQVWGISRTQLTRLIPDFQGFHSAAGETLPQFAERCLADGHFRPRNEVEEDRHWQQLIPYVVCRHRGQVLLLRRLPRQGEARLHERYSIGVGGHINPVDDEGSNPLVVGLERELQEELKVASPDILSTRLLGFVNDDSNAVGEVHFGVVCEVELSHGARVRETDKMEGQWQSPEELHQRYEGMETWSQLVVDAGVVKP